MYVVVENASGDVDASLHISGAFYSDFRNTRKPLDYQHDVVKIEVPIKWQDVTVGHLYLGLSLVELKQEIFSIRLTIGILSLIILIGGIFSIFVIVDVAMKPLREIVGTAKKNIRGGSQQES